VKLSKLKGLPIKAVSLKEQEPFVRLVDDILGLTTRNNSADSDEVHRQATVYEEKINALVNQLYGVSRSEMEELG
jgi:hypothetical protein